MTQDARRADAAMNAVLELPPRVRLGILAAIGALLLIPVVIISQDAGESAGAGSGSPIVASTDSPSTEQPAPVSTPGNGGPASPVKPVAVRWPISQDSLNEAAGVATRYLVNANTVSPNQSAEAWLETLAKDVEPAAAAGVLPRSRPQVDQAVTASVRVSDVLLVGKNSVQLVASVSTSPSGSQQAPVTYVVSLSRGAGWKVVAVDRDELQGDPGVPDSALGAR
jgi:hypothetical protein